MKAKWFWMMCMIVMASLVTIGCGDDDDETGSGSGNAPEGAITINLTKDNSYADFGAGYGGIQWRAPNNFDTGGTSVNFVDVGNKSGLGSISINKLPENGWTGEIACEEGHGYMVRCPMGEGEYNYTGVYVVDILTNTSKGIIGAKIQYCNFTPGKGWNQ